MFLIWKEYRECQVLSFASSLIIQTPGIGNRFGNDGKWLQHCSLLILRDVLLFKVPSTDMIVTFSSKFLPILPFAMSDQRFTSLLSCLLGVWYSPTVLRFNNIRSWY
jgi:hypothetical protein